MYMLAKQLYLPASNFLSFYAFAAIGPASNYTVSLKADTYNPPSIFLLCIAFNECTPDSYRLIAYVEVYSNMDVLEIYRICAAGCTARFFTATLISISLSRLYFVPLTLTTFSINSIFKCFGLYSF